MGLPCLVLSCLLTKPGAKRKRKTQPRQGTDEYLQLPGCPHSFPWSPPPTLQLTDGRLGIQRCFLLARVRISHSLAESKECPFLDECCLRNHDKGAAGSDTSNVYATEMQKMSGLPNSHAAALYQNILSADHNCCNMFTALLTHYFEINACLRYFVRFYRTSSSKHTKNDMEIGLNMYGCIIQRSCLDYKIQLEFSRAKLWMLVAPPTV